MNHLQPAGIAAVAQDVGMWRAGESACPLWSSGYSTEDGRPHDEDLLFWCTDGSCSLIKHRFLGCVISAEKMKMDMHMGHS